MHITFDNPELRGRSNNTGMVALMTQFMHDLHQSNLASPRLSTHLNLDLWCQELLNFTGKRQDKYWFKVGGHKVLVENRVGEGVTAYQIVTDV